MNLENRLVVAKGEGEGVGWTGNLGLIYADFCLWNGEATRFCIALETMSSHLQVDILTIFNIRKESHS